MKKITILALSCFLSVLVAAAALAETQYVNDLMEVTLRSGPGLDYRIKKMLPSGQELEVLDTEKKWANVRVPDGTTGWVFSKYVSPQKPDSLAVKEMREEIQPLRRKVESLTEENQRLIKRNQELSSSLEKTRAELEQAKNDYAALQEESKDYLKLREQHEAMKKELEEKNQRIQTLEKQVSNAFMSAGLKWFLAGAGVLILGMILGRTAAGKKKRPGLR
ncbi:MAG: TIGR04211 family SH3 domain-containing protein [Desulfobacteraceae bacterium]|nr:TIGR04211 family SH3 domain-containing protein [Desulfobacteraceae bacterium]